MGRVQSSERIFCRSDTGLQRIQVTTVDVLGAADYCRKPIEDLCLEIFCSAWVSTEHSAGVLCLTELLSSRTCQSPDLYASQRPSLTSSSDGRSSMKYLAFALLARAIDNR